VHEAAQVHSNQQVDQLQAVVVNSTIAAVPANSENILVDNSMNNRFVASVMAQTVTIDRQSLTEHAQNLRKWKALKYDNIYMIIYHIHTFTVIFNKLYPDVFLRFEDTVARDLLLQEFYIQKLPRHLFFEINR
jgi:hypothetical protein